MARRPSPLSFAGASVVITGASAGIGLACARAFAARGARLVLVARGQDGLDKAAASLASATTITTLSADVGDPAAHVRIVDAALGAFGAIDVLVNNAGFHPRGPFVTHGPEAFGQMVDVNLRAPIMLARRVLDPMLAAGRGAIVNVASLAGRLPLSHAAVYSATKFGLRAFSHALADELEGTGVTVSAVSPGPVDTGFIMDDLDHVPDIVLSQPMSTAEEVADLVVACAADGEPERAAPRVSGALTTLAYLAPRLRRALRPLMELQGRRNKQRYRARAAKR